MLRYLSHVGRHGIFQGHVVGPLLFVLFTPCLGIRVSPLSPWLGVYDHTNKCRGCFMILTTVCLSLLVYQNVLRKPGQKCLQSAAT